MRKRSILHHGLDSKYRLIAIYSLNLQNRNEQGEYVG